MKKYAFYEPDGTLKGTITETADGLSAENGEDSSFKRVMERMAEVNNAKTVAALTASGFTYVTIVEVPVDGNDEAGSS